MSSAPVSISDITFAYDDHIIFNHWSAQLTAGVTCVTGDDGAGKTTLLYLLNGTLTPQEGRITLHHDNMHQNTTAQQLSGKSLFFVDVNSTAFDHIVVQDYFDTLHTTYPLFDKVLLAQYIEGFSLTPHLEKELHMLSTGSKRKVWLAAALVSNVPLVLLDNPYAALDAPSIHFLNQTLLQKHQAAQQSIVVTCYEIPEQLSLVHCLQLA